MRFERNGQETGVQMDSRDLDEAAVVANTETGACVIVLVVAGPDLTRKRHSIRITLEGEALEAFATWVNSFNVHCNDDGGGN